jgi:hypothetical protein
MSDVSVIIRCHYCGSEIKVGNGELLKPPTPDENSWWAGTNPPNPTKIRLNGTCDAHVIGNQDTFTSPRPTALENNQDPTNAEREHEMQE